MIYLTTRRGSILSVNPGINAEEYIESTLKRFKLVDIKEQYNEAIQYAITKNLGYKDFLIYLLKLEEQGKMQRLINRNMKCAGFESIKTLEEYDFSFNNFQNMQKVKELSTLRFISEKENIILIGPPGVGKSHIATGLGMKACEAGKKVLFVNALELIDMLSKSVQDGNLKERLIKLSRIDLIIIDELGYLKMDKEKESIFFQLIRQRYEKNSLIITTNLPLGRWNEVFTSQIAATAILDRLVHHSHVISITGDSYRVKGKSKEVSHECQEKVT